MKLLAVNVFLFVPSANAFQIQQTRVAQSSTALKMGMFDFKPIHGAGTGSKNSEIEEQYEIQQEMLEARRDHINFNSLHGKYAEEDKTHDSDVFSLGKAFIRDKFAESYVDGEVTFLPASDSEDATSAAHAPSHNKKGKKFKFPWDLKT